MRDLRQAEEALARCRAANAQTPDLTSADRTNSCTLAPRLPGLWRQLNVTRPHKKALLRCLVDKVGIAVGALTSLARGA